MSRRPTAAGGAGLGAGQSMVANLVKNLRLGLFGSIFIMSKRVVTPAWRTKAELVIRIAQMLAFIVSPRVGAPWPGIMAPITFTSGIFNISVLSIYYRAQLLILLFYASLAFVLLVAVLLGYGIVSFMNGTIAVLWPLKLLRTCGSLAAGILFIPLLQQLLTAFECITSSTHWAAGYECGSPMVTALQVASALLSLVLVGLALLFSAVFYESNSLSSSLDARAHGRADLIMLLLQAALVVTTNTFAANLQLWVIVGVLAVAGVAWLGSSLLWMPYYVHWMNTANIAGACAYLWTVCCLIVNNYYRDANAGLLLYMGAPLAILSGFAMSEMRASGILRTPPSRLATPYEVELRARYMLHAALWGHPTVRSQDALRESAERNHASAPHAGAEAAALDDIDASDDADDRAAALRKLIPAAVIADVQALYRTAATRLRGSSILHVFCARFYSTWQGNRHMQFSHLLQAERRAPPLDVAYLVYAARKMAEDGASGGQQLSAMSRVAFDKYSSDARRYVQHAAQRQLSFWAELQDSVPDLARLHIVSKETNDAIAAAERSFDELFLINAQSISMLRLYAAFNLHVTCNAEKAGVLLSEADRLEDQKSKDHRSGEGNARLSLFAESSLDVWAENTSIISISAASRDLGTILSINAAACKLFGFARLQLERRPVFSLFSPPFDAYHDTALRTYVATGESSIVGYTRILFAMHKSGYMFPILSSLRDAPADDGPPSFIWLVRELRPPHQHVLMDDQFRLLGVTSGSQTLLGVTSASMAAREVRISDFVGEWEAPGILAELQTSAGTTLRVDTRMQVLDEEDGDGAADDDDEGDADSTRADNPNTAAATPRTPARTVASMRRSSLPFAWNGTPGDAPAADIQSTWVRAQLQRTEVAGASTCWLLHWQKIPESEAYILDKAASRRATLMGAPPSQSAARGPATLPMPHHGDNVLTSALAPPIAAASAFSSSRPAPLRARLSRGTSNRVTLITPEGTKAPSSDHVTMEVQLPSAVPDAAAAGAARTTSNSDAHDAALMNLLMADGATAQRTSLTGVPPSQEAPASADAEERVPPQIHEEEEAGVLPAALPPLSAAFAESARSGSSTARKLSVPVSGARSVASGSTRDKSDRDSRSSGGSSRKSATAQKAVNRLRRLLSEGMQPLLRGLWWLRAVGIVLTLLAVALAVTVSVITRSSFLQYYDNITYVGLGAKRMILKSSVIYAIQELLYHGRGWVPLDSATIAQRRADILSTAYAFRDVHTTMFDMVQGQATAKSYSSRYVTMTQFDVPANGLAGPYVIMNLMEVGASFVTVAQKLANANMSSFSDMNDPSVSNINYNFMRNGNGHEVLQRSMRGGYTSSLSTRDDVQRVQIVVFVAMVAVIAFFGGAVFLPILHTVEKTADTIMLQFVVLPVAVRRVLYMQALQRVRVLRRNFLADEDDLDTDSEDDDGGDAAVDLENPGAMLPANVANTKHAAAGDVQPGMNIVGDADDLEADVDWDDLLGKQAPHTSKSSRHTFASSVSARSSSSSSFPSRAAVSRSSLATTPALKPALKQTAAVVAPTDGGGETSVGSQGEVQHSHHRSRSSSHRSSSESRHTGYRKTGRSFAVLVLRFSTPLVGLLILFCVIFGNFMMTLNRSVTLTSIAAAANTRASCSRQSLMDLRKLAYLTTHSEYAINSYWITMNALDCVRWHVRLLGYGTFSNELNEPYVPYASPVENGQPSALSSASTNLVHGLMFGDACTYMHAMVPSFNVTRCRNFGGGVLTQGLAAATEELYTKAYLVADRQLRSVFTIGYLFQGLGWEMCAATFDYASARCIRAAGCVIDRDTNMPADGSALPPTPLPDFSYVGDVAPGPAPTNSCGPFTIAGELTSPEVKWLVEADSLYVTPAFLAIGALYEQEAKDNISNFLSFLSVFVPLYMITFAGIMLIFLRQVIATNTDIQAKRSMLLYLPLQVVARVKSIRALVDEILSQDASNSSVIATRRGSDSSTGR